MVSKDNKKQGLFRDDIKNIAVVRYQNKFGLELEYLDGSKETLKVVFSTMAEASTQAKKTLMRINEK